MKIRKQLQVLQEAKQTLKTANEALLTAAYEDDDRDLTEAEQSQFDERLAKLRTVDAKIANLESMLAIASDETSTDGALAGAIGDGQSTGLDANQDVTRRANAVAGVKDPITATRRIEFPPYRGTLMAFSGTRDQRTAEERAYRFGMWLMGIGGNTGVKRWCQDAGIGFKKVEEGNIAIGTEIGALYSEGTNTAGGWLVQPEFDTDIIRLVVQYGVFRRNARVSPMTGDTKTRPRRKTGLTAYFVGEGAAGTESTGSWDQVKLIAKKLMVLSRVTNELRADVVIDMADNLAYETALAFATKEDQCGFIGDGTSTYGGINGVVTRLKAINGVDDGGGLVLGAGNLMSEITLANHNTVVGRLPDYPGIDQTAKWYSSKVYYASVMQRLEAAAGGNTWQMIENGSRRKLCLGYQVETTDTLPKTDANSQVLAVFGDLRLAADLGDRAQITITMSDSASVDGESVFERDEFAYRATERFDINVHDVGDATNPGPIVGLISAAS